MGALVPGTRQTDRGTRPHLPVNRGRALGALMRGTRQADRGLGRLFHRRDEQPAELGEDSFVDLASS